MAKRPLDEGVTDLHVRLRRRSLQDALTTEATQYSQ